MPPGFADLEYAPNNVPRADYETDGGFIGRAEELGKLHKLLLSKLDRVITITGAGGVGKTALAIRLCESLLRTQPAPFDAIVWTSAKEETLGLTGIELLDPLLKTFDDLLGSILETVGWVEDLDQPLPQRLEAVEAILASAGKGVLIVIDNLETVHDERIIEFIKDIPHPNKALLTSRLGLGEVERRYPLKALNRKEALALFRSVSREKGLDDVVALPDDALIGYVEKLSFYPLAIKWVVGQLSLGRDINTAICDSAASTGDIARFCFEHIFDRLVPEQEKLILYALASQDLACTKAVLCHLSNQPLELVEAGLQNLSRASLVVVQHKPTDTGTVETRYDLLPLTRSYVFSKLQAQDLLLRDIRARIDMVQHVVDEGDRAKREYKYTFWDMGATTDEEKVAAAWSINAYQRFESGDYAAAVAMFERAAKIAPSLATIYRNWARVESLAGFYERSRELIQRSVDLAPKDARMWREWGSIEMKATNYTAAVEKIETALQLEPEDELLLNLLAEVEKRRYNHERADGLFRRALAIMKAKGSADRQRAIALTALADNLRKWTEVLRQNGNSVQAAAKLNEAFAVCSEAVSLEGSARSLTTYREISFDLGRLLASRNPVEARVYFEKSIMRDPLREGDRRRTVFAGYFLADMLSREGRLKDARDHYELIVKLLRPTDDIRKDCELLGLEFKQTRRRGVLSYVNTERGFGFLSENPADTGTFLHFRSVVPSIRGEEFESLRGRTFSFLLEEHGAGQARAARAVVVSLESPIVRPG
jgi:LuxR family glucitol operon transcriptional activator